LLGAVRLPNTAFQANAGTSVTADILFLRKREATARPTGHAWEDLRPIETEDGPAYINEYFAAHPEMMLGVPSLGQGQYGRELALGAFTAGMGQYSAAPQASMQAYGLLHGILLQQANLGAYVDMFRWTGLIMACCLPGAWLLKKVISKGKVASH
jgi:hypothetical protein